MRFFVPSLGNYIEGHYDTFLQSCIRKEHTYGDSGHATKCRRKNLGKCKFCRSYYFKSKADKTRHNGMFHRRQRREYVQASFSCEVCQSCFIIATKRKKNILADV